MSSSLNYDLFSGPPEMSAGPYEKDPRRNPNLENCLCGLVWFLKIMFGSFGVLLGSGVPEGSGAQV